MRASVDAVPATADAALAPFVLQPASGRVRVPAELGRIVVPENRAARSSRSLELYFLRLRSPHPDPGPPLFLLSGGPGDSGIEETRLPGVFEVLMAVREARDVVAVDQRGTGLSTRLRSLRRWGLPLDAPATRQAALAAAAAHVAADAEHWSGLGVDLAGYTTSESSDDLDAVREALGYPSMCLWGASYGSHLALATIRRHGSRVERAILEGVEGPDHTLKLPSVQQAQLERLAAMAADAAVPGAGELLGQLAEVLDRLERSPATVTVADPMTSEPRRVAVGRFDLQWALAPGLGDRAELAALPGRVRALADGDLSWLGAAALTQRTEWFSSCLAVHMDCASGASPERRARVRREAAETLLGDAMDFPLLDACDAAACSALDASFRAPVASDVPTLFLSGTLDARTPPENAEEVLAGFPNGRHVVVEGGVHEYYAEALPELASVLAGFLDGRDVEDRRWTIPFAFA